MKTAGFIKSKLYHIVILSAAALIIVLGGIYRKSIAEKSAQAGEPVIEELKGEIEIIKNALTKNELEAIESLIDEVTRRIRPAVVSVKPVESAPSPRSAYVFEDYPKNLERESAPPQFESGVSGLLIDREGHILTSANAVRSATQFNILFSNSSQRIADLVALDAGEHLALLKLRETDLGIAPPEFARTRPARAGEWLINLGRLPSGQPSLSLAMLSAIRQDLMGRETYHLNLEVQPDQDGSAAASLEGRVIGINLRLTESGDTRSMTIPIARVLDVAQRLKAGAASTGQSWIGLELQDMDENLKKHFAIEQGAVIIRLKEDSPAMKAGLKSMDIITSVDGVPAPSARAIIEQVNNKPAGSILKLTIRRNSIEQSVTVQTASFAEGSAKGLGVKNPADERSFGIEIVRDSSLRGAEIKSVRLQSDALRLGLKAGDLIVEINGARITDYSGFLDKQKSIADDQSQIWQIERQDKRFLIAISRRKTA